jgi:uncharacterized membrane protein
MTSLSGRALAAHRFLARHAFYQLAAFSSLAVALLAGRVYLLHTRSYLFLGWNLLLAWVPYACALWAAAAHERRPREWWPLVLPGALWLVFFPNAPYIVTDFIHLERMNGPWWYNLGTLASCAGAGLLLALFSLRALQRLVVAFLGWLAGWLFVGVAAVLCGLGIYVGRVLRWNSWDLLLNPRPLLSDVMDRMLHPSAHTQTLGVTLVFAALMLVCYAAVFAPQREPVGLKDED